MTIILQCRTLFHIICRGERLRSPCRGNIEVVINKCSGEALRALVVATLYLKEQIVCFANSQNICSMNLENLNIQIDFLTVMQFVKTPAVSFIMKLHSNSCQIAHKKSI